MTTKQQDNVQTLKVTRIFDEAENIRSFELVHPDGDELEAFEAGAHIHIHISDKLSRQYSLCNNPAETHRYLIAVLNEPGGRGGSLHMHTNVAEGDLTNISGPKNNFPLATRGAKQHLLLAGGIGITPMVAMVHSLEDADKPYTLHYCTKTKSATAFQTRLESLVKCGEINFHHDGGDPARGLDIAAAIGEYRVGVHIYACGPPGFMYATNQAVKHWPPHVVHQEYFAARELTDEEKSWDARPFDVALRKSGKVVHVAASQSIVDALRENDVPIATDCTEGYCGTCITRYTGGEPVHRDSVLDDVDRESFVMVCCARSKTDQLELDL